MGEGPAEPAGPTLESCSVTSVTLNLVMSGGDAGGEETWKTVAQSSRILSCLAWTGQGCEAHPTVANRQSQVGFAYRERAAPISARTKSTHPRSAPTVEKNYFLSGLGPLFGVFGNSND